MSRFFPLAPPGGASHQQQRRHSASEVEKTSTSFKQSRSSHAEEHSSPKMIYPSSCLTNLIAQISLEGKKKLKDLNFYPNWLCLPSEIILHESEVEGIISHLKNHANEMLPRDDSERQLLTYGFAPIMCNNTLAFMMILQRNFHLADDCLTESNRLIDICFNGSPSTVMAKDYLSGIFYLVKGIKILLESFTGSLGRTFDFNAFLMEAIENFEDLPLKARVAVWVSKNFFLRLFNRRKIQYTNINEIVYNDPDYFEWRLYQYLYTRQQRCQQRGFESPPSASEIQAIQHAWNLFPSNPYCIVYLARCLTEQLRTICWKDEAVIKSGFICGQWSFSTQESAATYIKELCLNVVKLNQLSVKINLLVSDIFGTLMPFKQRDPGQARHYVFQAFRFGQNTSSKANHRMALTLLCNIKSPASNPKHCEDLLEKAWKLDNRNTDALYQLLLVYLHHPKECYHKIRLLFATYLSSFDLPEAFIQKLIFLKGCFYMMTGEYEYGIVTWMSVYSNYATRIDFSMLQYYSYVFRVFQWNLEFLNLPFIISETNKFLTKMLPTTSSPSSPSLRQTKNILMEMMQDQYQALNADNFYTSTMSPLPGTSPKPTSLPIHYQLPSTPPTRDDQEPVEQNDGLFFDFSFSSTTLSRLA